MLDPTASSSATQPRAVHIRNAAVGMKIYRARELAEELRQRLVDYYTSTSFVLQVSPESPLNDPQVEIVASCPIPAKYTLILGDSLQCLRSSLDYLVYELKHARGIVHGTWDEFPIVTEELSFAKSCKRKVPGLDSSIVDTLRQLQPYRAPIPAKHPLALLNRLVNINKHNRLIFSRFHSLPSDQLGVVTFPTVRARGRLIFPDGTWKQASASGYVSISDSELENEEICSLLERVAEYVIVTVCPAFDRFL